MVRSLASTSEKTDGGGDYDVSCTSASGACLFPLTRPWAWGFLIIGVIGTPVALGLVLRAPDGYGSISLACSLAFLAIGLYRVFRPFTSR
jgi:hypothetical protein